MKVLGRMGLLALLSLIGFPLSASRLLRPQREVGSPVIDLAADQGHGRRHVTLLSSAWVNPAITQAQSDLAAAKAKQDEYEKQSQFYGSKAATWKAQADEADLKLQNAQAEALAAAASAPSGSPAPAAAPASHAKLTNVSSNSIWPAEKPDPASGYGVATTKPPPAPVQCPPSKTVTIKEPCNQTVGGVVNASVTASSTGTVTMGPPPPAAGANAMSAAMAAANSPSPSGAANSPPGVTPPAASTDPGYPAGYKAGYDAAKIAIYATTTTPPVPTTNQFHVLANSAADAASAALRAAALATAGMPSAEAIQAQAAAERAVIVAEGSKSISAQAYAVAAGVNGAVQSLRHDLAAAASARAGALDNVRVGKPTMPVSPQPPASQAPKGAEVATR